jgi:L-alanine-DL-glutamate epimerase-like enolase superfamily enzyme
MRLGALVHAHNVRYAPHTGFSCGVAHLASLHLAGAVPNLWKLEEMYIQNELMHLFTEGLPRAKDGVVQLPTRPGLGLTLDKKKIAKYRLT